MTNEYDGHWIATYTGKQFHYLDPQPEEIDIKDIAHALALTCRFGGHCKGFYSVADHSIRVAQIILGFNKLQALLHDAHEAYLHDVPRPIKQEMPIYKEIANKIQQAIYDKFCPIQCPDNEIKYADDVLLATEARDLMNNTNEWAELPLPLPDKIVPMPIDVAESRFLRDFERYRGKLK